MSKNNHSFTSPIALTIAGSDSGGGAGIQADLKTFSALGVYGASVITAITAQNTIGVSAVHNIPETIVSAQLKAVLNDLKVATIKIGMLASTQIIQAVAEALKEYQIPIVLDPVMIAKSGDKLLQQDAIEYLKLQLIPQATLLTPNLPEAATLLDCGHAKTKEEMLQQGEALLKLGANAVLMKGGHAPGDECVDLLITRSCAVQVFRSKRINSKNTHGTGCTLSSAIAANLAKSTLLGESVEIAHNYLQHAILAADCLQIGTGQGPVHHFHALWSNQFKQDHGS